jgi:hypothetical protein
MRKKMVVLVLVTLFVLVAATPVLAAGSRFSLVGKITAIDLGAGTITLDVYNGNPLIKGEQAVQVTDGTRFWRCGEGPITFDKVGLEEAVVRGRVEGGVFVAERVTVSPLHLKK